MLHVVTGANRHLYGTQLTQMHRQRYELFVLRRGWNLPVRDGGEYDEGDDERAVYLLALDRAGDCRGSMRLRPADDFSYLIDRMPEWVDGDPQALRQDPNLWEIARWINQGGRRTGQEIRIGMVEYLLSRGAVQGISCPDEEMARYALDTGWRLRFLGSPRRYPEGGVAVAITQPVSAAEVEYLRAYFGRRDPVLMEISPDAPWAHLPLPQIEQAFRACARVTSSGAALHAAADARLRAMTGA
jgi:N-acyl-L-homoserine lactone synthetase